MCLGTRSNMASRCFEWCHLENVETVDSVITFEMPSMNMFRPMGQNNCSRIVSGSTEVFVRMGFSQANTVPFHMDAHPNNYGGEVRIFRHHRFDPIVVRPVPSFACLVGRVQLVALKPTMTTCSPTSVTVKIFRGLSGRADAVIRN